MPDPIKHVVLLMLENHSFDQMMGALQKVYPDLDGIPADSPSRINFSLTGEAIPQAPVGEKQMHLDPLHEVEAVAEQMANNNSGFVINFEKQYKKKAEEEVPFIMGYYPLDF